MNNIPVWERKRNEIRYAQALNCSVALVSAVIQNPLRKEPLGDEQVKQIITTWRDWFYMELSKDFPEASGERVPLIDERTEYDMADERFENDQDHNVHRFDDLPRTPEY